MLASHRTPPPGINLLAFIGIVTIGLSYFYPGFRISNIPAYIPAVLSLLFVPFVFRAFSKGRAQIVTFCFCIFVGVIGYNNAIGIFQARDLAYLTLPVGAILAAAMIFHVSDRIGVERTVQIAVGASLVNLAVMIAQSVDLFSIITLFSSLWQNAITFVSYDDDQAQILWATLSIRPPGFFPTGIFASTVIYISLRAHYALYKRYIVFVPITLAIMITANRTLAAFFVVFESYRLIVERGFMRFLIVASLVVLSASAALFILLEFDVKLYIVQFIFDEVLRGGLGQTGSVTGRLNTYDFFISVLPKYWLLGGFSSDELAGYGGVFDSEIMLRTLQFGVPGTLALALVVLLPRRPGATADWWFLPAIAFAASLTTTLVTSVIYTVVLAIYREAVLYRQVVVEGGSEQPHP